MADETEIVGRILARQKVMEREKDLWNPHYQKLAERFLTRKANFTSEQEEGAFLNTDVFDNTGQQSAYLAASMFVSMQWPDAARTFRLKPAHWLKDDKDAIAWFRAKTVELQMYMDKPEAGLQTALLEKELDKIIFGTGSVSAFDAPDADNMRLPFVFESWDVKRMFILQNAQGVVDILHIKDKTRTARQIVLEYVKPGDKVAAEVKETAKSKPDEKIEILKVIEPKAPEKGKRGVAGMAVRTLHIDTKHKTVMREGGYEEMPVFVSRMFKRLEETYGRSSGMIALPDAESLNALTEAVIIAVEKQLDPPLALLDSGTLGGATVDTSAGALSVLKVSGRLGTEKPLYPLFTVGEIQSAKDLREHFIEKIAQAFFLDRLLDLNNQVQMTAYETSLRNKMRGEALAAVFARDFAETHEPLIRRCFNVLWRKGYFGETQTGAGAKMRGLWARILGKAPDVVPEKIRQAIEAGLDVYEIEYICPARRFMRAEKLQGLFQALDATLAASTAIPTVLDRIPGDDVVESIFDLSGAPDILISRAEAMKAREAQVQKQSAVEALQSADMGSKIGAQVAQARQAMGTIKSGGAA